MKKLHIPPVTLKLSSLLLILFLAVLFTSGSASAQGDPPPTILGPMVKIVTAPPSPTPSYFPRNETSGHAPKQATITVTYILGDVTGCPASVNSWDDTPPGESATLRQAFERAVSTWENTLDSPVNIRVEVTLENLGGNTLGSMGPYGTANWGTQPVDNVWFAYAIADKFNGSDLDPSNVDISGSMTCRDDWNTDDASSDGDGYTGEYDFESVAVHELGHGLGFVGGATYDGATGNGGVRDDTHNYPWVYTCFTGSANPHGRYLLNQNEFPEDSVPMGDVLTNKGGASNNGAPGVYFYGNHAVNANGGAVKLYSPDTWQDGSSYSHLDSATFDGTADDLMTPSIGPGDITRSLGPVTSGMFDDFGWTTPFNAEACASPTPNAVTLQGMATTYTSAYMVIEKNNITPFAVAGILALITGAIGIFLYRRK